MSNTNIAKALNRKLARSIRVSLPARIEEYDYKTQKAKVRIDIQETYENGESQEYPIINNVPVIFPKSGGASFTMPVKRGDSCLLLFLDRDLTAWLQGKSGEKTGSQRMHNINDAVAVMGLSPFNEASPAQNNTDVLLQFDDSHIAIKPEGNLEIYSAGLLSIKTDKAEIECQDINIKTANTITIEDAKSIEIKCESIAVECKNANIKASEGIRSETPNFVQKGNLKIEGDIEVEGKSLLKGNADCQGTIKANSVKTSSGIDLGRHKHNYQEAQAGSNPTVVTPSMTGTPT